MIVSINPATEAEIDAALSGAVRAQATWRVLRAGKERYAALITPEMRKPLPESEGEIELGVDGIREFVNVRRSGSVRPRC